MDCEEVKGYMVEYIDDTLDPDTKELVACHLDRCDTCFNEIKALDNTMWSLKESSRIVKVPADFMDRIEEQVVKKYNPGAGKAKRLLKIAACVLICAALAYAGRFLYYNAPKMARYVRYRAIMAVAPEKLYGTEYGTYGRKLDISSTDKGIKITATKIVADDIQTLVYFKVDNPDNKDYMVGKMYSLSMTIWQDRIMISPDEFVVCGRPFDAKNKQLHISISSMYSSSSDNHVWQEIQGRWEFDIPAAEMDIEALKSKSYDIDYTVNLGGSDAVRFKRFICAPSGCYLIYDLAVNNQSGEFSLDNISMQSGERKLSMLQNYTGGIDTLVNGYTYMFESLYPAKPENIKVNIPSCTKEITDTERKIPINLNGSFPVEFDYLGNKLYINKLKTQASDNLIRIELTEPKGARNYYRLMFMYDDIVKNGVLRDIEVPDYYVVDEDGVEYDYNDINKDSQKYAGKNLYMYPVKTVFTIQPDAGKDIKELTFTIMGHSTINRVNKTIQLDLKQ